METNLQEKTNYIIQKSQLEGVEKPFCVGISENLLTFLARDLNSLMPKILPIEDIPNTELKLYAYEGLPFRGGLLPCLFKIDAKNHRVNLSLNLQIDFYDNNPPIIPFAVTNFIVKAQVDPHMATSHRDFLAFKVKSVELVGEINYPQLNPDEVIKRFGSIEKFKNYVEKIVNQICEVNVESEFNTIVSSLFSGTELPNTWRFVEGYKVNFKEFYYEEGILRDEPCGFLFIVFSTRHLNSYPSCYSSLNLQETNTYAEDQIKLVKNLEGGFESEDRWITVGVSESAILEIAYPYFKFNKRIRNMYFPYKRPVSGEVSYWVDFHLKHINVCNDNICIELYFKTGGSVLSFARDRILGTEVSATNADIELAFKHISAKAIVERRLNPDIGGMEIYIKPNFKASNPDLKIEDSTSYPLSHIVDLIKDEILNRGVTSIEDKLNNNLSFPLFISKINRTGDFGLYFERVDFYNDCSVVITGLGTDD
ncbi:hypothetical protein CN501_15635 [Bacillus cereus]|uniref:hypothetical protein n=1 Tax=Bacillus cereus TaxID=1396 RepID=UPI000BEE6394|nr:hypothetical protein [Bacillus cereus]PED02208.1 hypothetical protein CON14_14395 [Bacillus cereus]PES13092.1 hypothetical protein CN501_15635 [Bacillus cereus]